MKTFLKLLCGAALLPATLFGQVSNDSIADTPEKQLALNEIVVVARRPVVKQQEGKLIYLVKNDPYAAGLDGITLLDRIPRVSVNNGSVTVAGKGKIRYIIDGLLMELDDAAMSARLKSLSAENIEKIELLTTPPSRYSAEPNTAFISIKTKNETLGTRGNVYASLNQGNKLREYFTGSISHTTRRVEMSFDANLSNYYATNDNEIEYLLTDASRLSSTRTDSHLFNTGFNGLFKYKFSPDMKLGALVNYNYESTTADGLNTSTYSTGSSKSLSHTSSRPNNALTLTSFFDWSFGKNGETVELTYNYFDRHSPAASRIETEYNDRPGKYIVEEDGAGDYRFHNGRADFKLPFKSVQIEAGAGYTDILNTTDNDMRFVRADADDAQRETNRFKYTERIAAAYLAASRNFGKGLWAKVGLRYEHTRTVGEQSLEVLTYRKNYGQLFPTVNLSWNNAKAGTFNISYSMGMGRPNLWELNPFRYYSTNDEYAAGNPDLQPTIYNNAEINYYGLGGLYAVIYTSFASDAIGYIRRINNNGVVSTRPYNCLSTNKTGLYASYKRSFFDRWELKAGGEVFHTSSRGNMPDFRVEKLADWSGKLEVSTDIMLNRQKSLIFSAHFTHFFPWQQNMIRYESFQLFNFSLRYSLLKNHLNLRITANDIFGWSKTRSTQQFDTFSVRQTFNAHSAYVLLGISGSFGRDKVRGVWRASKEEQSRRTK